MNGLSSFLLLKGSKNDINVRSAYLHLLADALVSAGVVVGGAIIYFTGYLAVDPIISIVVSVVMIWGVMDLLKTSVRMNFDGVPAGMNVSEIRKELLGIPGVEDIHDLHVWSLSTTENAMTAHVVIGKDADKRKIKDSILLSSCIGEYAVTSGNGHENVPIPTADSSSVQANIYHSPPNIMSSHVSIKKALLLFYFTVAYNVVEGVVSILFRSYFQ